MMIGLPTSRGVVHHASHRVADDGFRLMIRLAVGDQWHSEGVNVVAVGVSHTHRQVVRVEIDTDDTVPFISDHRHVHHSGGSEHPPTPLVTLEPVADGLAQTGGTRRLLTVLTPAPGIIGSAGQRLPATAHARG